MLGVNWIYPQNFIRIGSRVQEKIGRKFSIYTHKINGILLIVMKYENVTWQTVIPTMKGVNGWLYCLSIRAVTVAKFIINVKITFQDLFIFLKIVNACKSEIN